MTMERTAKKQGSGTFGSGKAAAMAMVLAILFSASGSAQDGTIGVEEEAVRVVEETTRVVEGDLIRIPVGQQPGSPHTTNLPRTGETRSVVLRRLGEPEQRRAAVGDPPISAWEYSDIVVYFEHDHVIHAVRKHTPKVSAGR